MTCDEEAAAVVSTRASEVSDEERVCDVECELYLSSGRFEKSTSIVIAGQRLTVAAVQARPVDHTMRRVISRQTCRSGCVGDGGARVEADVGGNVQSIDGTTLTTRAERTSMYPLRARYVLLGVLSSALSGFLVVLESGKQRAAAKIEKCVVLVSADRRTVPYMRGAAWMHW